MTPDYLRRLIKVAHETLPGILKARPFMYWHFKTTLILASNGDFSAAKDLAEQLGGFIGENIESCKLRGDISSARELENAKANIMEGIES